jgi:hypothetical protein
MHQHSRGRWLFAAASILSFSATAATVRYTGMCDASAAVMLDRDKFVVASDEDAVLRVYSLSKPGEYVSTTGLNGFLKLKKKEPDIEGSARIGNRIYWITSHGTNSEGEARPDRRRFFATDLVQTSAGVNLVPVGIGNNSIEALFSSAIGERYGLKEKATHPPETPEGLNIEGLASGPAGSVLIGFRNPIPGGRALLVTLSNPAAFVTVPKMAPEFGKVIEIDLGGLGIRSIDAVPGTEEYVIAAGAADNGPFALFGWRVGQEPVRLDIGMPGDFHPEALMFDSDAKNMHVLSDDGDDACKKGKRAPTFRLMTVPLPTW